MIFRFHPIYCVLLACHQTGAPQIYRLLNSVTHFTLSLIGSSGILANNNTATYILYSLHI